MRLRKTPIPEATKALDDETRVRLSHLGVVSKRRWMVKAVEPSPPCS